MGLLSKLGGAVKEGARNGAVKGLLKASGNSAATGKLNYAEYEYDANGNIKGVNSTYASDISNKFGTGSNSAMHNLKNISTSGTGIIFDGKSSSIVTTTALPRPKNSNGDKINPEKYSGSPAGIRTNTASLSYKNRGNELIQNDSYSDIYKLKLPDWSYADFINERAVWQKGLSSILDEPAWFYFKIFFDFNTNHGLFGGLLNSTYLTSATNSAAKYLYSVRKLHVQEKPKDRIISLYKFASILSYINTSAPWYFKGIRNLNKALIPTLNEFSKENYIEIETSPDAIDMRLSTIMSLYSYACFDKYQYKEIIPQNLRKFNMSIILFQSPLRYLHTSYTTHKKAEFLGINTDSLPFANKLLNKGTSSKVYYKNMSATNRESSNFGDMMSMKIITLYGCEFDIDSIGSMIPGDISNETPFQLGKNSIKINYMYSVEHTMNEFFGMMFGSDGFYFNQYSNFQTLAGLDEGFDGYVNATMASLNKQNERYQALIDTFGNMTNGGTILGIIDSPKSYKEAIDATESLMNGFGESSNMLTDLGVNFALGLLGSSQNTSAPQGNLYGDYGLNSAYYKDKLEMLKNGVHERTTAPYYYDPYTGARMDLHKSRNYTAYNFKNDVSNIKQFDVNNWLINTSTNLGSSLNGSLRDVFYGKSDFVQNPYIDSATGKWKNENNNVSEPGFTKAGEKGKTQVMVDNPNDWRTVEKPYNYDPKKPVEGGIYKNLSLNDNPNTWDRVEKPKKIKC